jgi:hypothetical protein
MLHASSQRQESRGNLRPEETPIELAGLPVPSQEWHAIVTLGPNVLVEGPEFSAEILIQAVTASLQGPVYEWGSSAPVQEPGATLIVRRVDLLNAEEHRRLLDYLNTEGAETRVRQVIATSTQSLYALVESGLFDADLYYRLNTIRLELAEPS